MPIGSGVSEYGDDARNSPTRRRSESMCSFARLALAHHDVRWSIQVRSYDTITATSSHPASPFSSGFSPDYLAAPGSRRWQLARAAIPPANDLDHARARRQVAATRGRRLGVAAR